MDETENDTAFGVTDYYEGENVSGYKNCYSVDNSKNPYYPADKPKGGLLPVRKGNEPSNAVKEYLAQGGKITYCPPADGLTGKLLEEGQEPSSQFRQVLDAGSRERQRRSALQEAAEAIGQEESAVWEGGVSGSTDFRANKKKGGTKNVLVKMQFRGKKEFLSRLESEDND